MKKFDFANFIGRVLLSLYFIINSTLFFWMVYTGSVQQEGLGFWIGIGILEFLSGIMLLVGAKPRVAAGVLGFFILVKIVIVLGGFGTTPWEMYHGLSNIAAASKEVDIRALASFYAQFLFGKIAVLGACLFMVGARTIPHSVFARSESNLRKKYGL